MEPDWSLMVTSGSARRYRSRYSGRVRARLYTLTLLPPTAAAASLPPPLTRTLTPTRTDIRGVCVRGCEPSLSYLQQQPPPLQLLRLEVETLLPIVEPLDSVH